LNFDFSQADVSCKYDIHTTVSPDSAVKDLIVTGYSIDSTDINDIIPVTDSTDISDEINYSDHITSRNIRIYLV